MSFENVNDEKNELASSGQRVDLDSRFLFTLEGRVCVDYTGAQSSKMVYVLFESRTVHVIHKLLRL